MPTPNMDRLDLWKDTLLIFTTDHGTYNGDHDRIGKLQTHEHDAVGYIPFIACHPTHGHGQRRAQPVQLVDIYATTLRAMGKPVPDQRHGLDLLSLFENPDASTREFAVAGQFGKSVALTDGDWIPHQSPVAGKQPLNWYGHHLAKFQPYDLGDYEHGRRPVRNHPDWGTPTWLSDKRSDPNELENLTESRPDERQRMQRALKETLTNLGAPAKQAQRLGC